MGKKNQTILKEDSNNLTRRKALSFIVKKIKAIYKSQEHHLMLYKR